MDDFLQMKRWWSVGNYARRLLHQALQQPESLLTERRFWKREVFDLFLQHTRDVMSASPRRALPLAQIGPEFAVRVSPAEDVLHARALAVLGSAFRAVGDFGQSDSCFTQAEDLELPELELADICRRKAYLRAEQRQLGQAFDLVNRSIRIYRLEGDLFDRTPLGKALIARGYLHHQAGRSGDSLVDLSAAVCLVDGRAEPKSYYGALHNLSLLLVEDGSPHQVGLALEQLKVAYRHFIGYSQRHVAKYKLRWLQGLAHLRFDAVRKAELDLEQARKGFVEVNAPLEFAVISLDLGLIYLNEQR